MCDDPTYGYWDWLDQPLEPPPGQGKDNDAENDAEDMASWALDKMEKLLRVASYKDPSLKDQAVMLVPAEIAAAIKGRPPAGV